MAVKDLNIETEFPQEFRLLHQRQDNDMKIHYLDKYVMSDNEGNPIPDVDSVTLNDPRVFGDSVVAVLAEDKKRFDIMGVDEAKQNRLESKFDESFYINDMILENQLIEEFEFCLNWFGCIRGWDTGLSLVLGEGDRRAIYMLPIDPRWTSWKIGARGMLEFKYLIRMSKETAEARYKKTIPMSATDLQLKCVITKDTMITSEVTTNFAFEVITHNYGFVPAYAIPAPTQPMIISQAYDIGTSLAKQGESIYAVNREIYKQINELASIWKTMAKQQFMTPLAFTGNRKFTGRPYGIGIVVELRENEKLLEIPTKELSASAQNLFGQLMGNAQRGGWSNINYGELKGELSSLAVAQLTDTRDKILAPRRKLKKKVYRTCIELIRKQIANDLFIPTQVFEDEEIKLDKKLFEEKFTVNVDFSSVSPEQNVVNINNANQAKVLGYPMEDVFRDIMKDPHPKQTMRKAKAERASMAIPALDQFEQAMALTTANVSEELIDNTKANIILAHLEETLQMPVGDVRDAMAKNMPSQPRNEMTNRPIDRDSTETIAAKKLKQSGQMENMNASKAKKAGV